MTSGGKYAALKLIAIVSLLREVPLVIEGDHTPGVHMALNNHFFDQTLLLVVYPNSASNSMSLKTR